MEIHDGIDTAVALKALLPDGFGSVTEHFTPTNGMQSSSVYRSNSQKQARNATTGYTISAILRFVHGVHVIPIQMVAVAQCTASDARMNALCQ